MSEPNETDQPGSDASSEAHAHEQEGRRRGGRLGVGVDDISRVVRALFELRPLGQETIERIFEGVLKLLNRREVLERILRSEFMHNIRDMQSEITEAVGIASQADVQDLKKRLDGVTERLERLQRTLDEIAVEVDEA